MLAGTLLETLMSQSVIKGVLKEGKVCVWWGGGRVEEGVLS